MDSTKDSKSSRYQPIPKAIRDKLRPAVKTILANATGIAPWQIRDWCLRQIKVLVRVKPGRRRRPRTDYALQRRLAGDEWPEILRAPECIGPKPKDQNLAFTWDSAARSIMVSVERDLRELRGARKTRTISPRNTPNNSNAPKV